MDKIDYSKHVRIDWEQRRYEIAKEMLPVLFKEWATGLRSGQNPENPYQLIVSGSVKWADDLIKELKKCGSSS